MRVHHLSTLCLAAFAAGLFGCYGVAPKGPKTQNQILGILCTADLTVTGHFTPSMPQPTDVVGCWPVGTWTFNAAVKDNTCPQAPVLEDQYAFADTRDAEDLDSFSYLNDPSYPRVHMRVTSGGGGLCEGSLEVFSTDGTKVVNLKPALQGDQTINGEGEWQVFGEDQWQ